MARRGETGDDPASTMSAGGSHGESNGATGLYNVSNTCYLNSVLQALSHVREFRECLLSDEAGEIPPPPLRVAKSSALRLLLFILALVLIRYTYFQLLVNINCGPTSIAEVVENDGTKN